MSTAWEDSIETIRAFPSNECGRGSYPLNKAIFFWTQQGFDYGYGKGFRDQNISNLDKGTFKAVGDFETMSRFRESTCSLIIFPLGEGQIRRGYL